MRQIIIKKILHEGLMLPYKKHKSNREKIFIGGHEYWLDRKKEMLFDSETAKNGIYYDIIFDNKVRSRFLTPNEENELADYLKNNPYNEE